GSRRPSRNRWSAPDGRRGRRSGARFASPPALAFPRLRRRERSRPGHRYLAGAPLLIAHRGGSALAPENTLAAFRRALAWWRTDLLEIDVRPTRDGDAVVIHDATVDRTTDGSGPVSA